MRQLKREVGCRLRGLGEVGPGWAHLGGGSHGSRVGWRQHRGKVVGAHSFVERKPAFQWWLRVGGRWQMQGPDGGSGELEIGPGTAFALPPSYLLSFIESVFLGHLAPSRY